MQRKNRGLKAAASVSMIILISKVFGFLRESIIAAYFGTGAQADAYASAYGIYYIPILLFGSCISSTLIPMYTERRNTDGLEEANRFASNALNVFTVFALLVAGLMFAFSGPLVSVLYRGFDAEKHDLTVQLLRVMLPVLGFAIIAQVLLNILNAQKHFIAAQLTGFPLSICTICAAVFFSKYFGIMALAVGVIGTAILQVLVEIPALRKDFRYSFSFKPGDAAIKRMLLLALPAILSMSATEINNLVDRFMASQLTTGTISGMNYAFRLVTFVNGFIVVPLVTVAFARMSEMAAASDKKGVLAHCRECALVIIAIVLPITILGSLMARPVIRIVFMRGAFDEQSLALTSGIFSMYILGELFFGLRDLLSRAFNAFKDTVTPMAVAMVMIIFNIIFNVVLVKLIGVNGLPLSTTLSGAISMLMLLALLHKKAGHIGLKTIVPELARIVVATILAGVVCFILCRVIPEPSGFLPAVLYLGGIGVVCVGVYYTAAWLLGSTTIREFDIRRYLGKILRKLRRS